MTMLVTVVVFFFACMLPFKLLTLWIVTLSDDVFKVIDVETFYLLLYFCRVMFYINSAINPILYNIMSSKFREGFRKVFHCINWPLTPRRLRLVEATHRRTASPNDWTRRKTVSSSLRPNNRTIEHEASPSSSSRQRLTTTVTIERSPQFSRTNDEEGDTNRQKRQSWRHNQSNFSRQHQESFRHQQPHGSHQNIVFIEERKILVIPTSTTSSEHKGNARPASH